MDKKAVDKARSLYYGFMSKMLVFTTSKDRYDGVMEVLDLLIENPLDVNSQKALQEIQEFINIGGYEAMSKEYDEIFHNPETTIVRTTASFYDEGVESGRKTLEVRNFLAKTRIRRNEKTFKELEDSVGFLVTLMHDLIELVLNGEKSYETLQHCLFKDIINEFFDEFIINLYMHEKANVYKSLSVVLVAFLEFERLYLDIAKPVPKEKPTTQDKSCEFISDEEAKRRAENRAKRAAELLQQSCSLEDTYDIE